MNDRSPRRVDQVIMKLVSVDGGIDKTCMVGRSHDKSVQGGFRQPWGWGLGGVRAGTGRAGEPSFMLPLARGGLLPLPLRNPPATGVFCPEYSPGQEVERRGKASSQARKGDTGAEVGVSPSLNAQVSAQPSPRPPVPHRVGSPLSSCVGPRRRALE